VDWRECGERFLLVAYALGLSATLLAVALLAIALLGQRALGTARCVADAHGPFRRGLGPVFILVAIVVIAGWDKDLQAWVVEYAPVGARFGVHPEVTPRRT
jgi:cytochrome c-type biogenesis protein